MDRLQDNADAGQYELDIDGQTVFARYRREDGC
jgi:hypothetical protein